MPKVVHSRLSELHRSISALHYKREEMTDKIMLVLRRGHALPRKQGTHQGASRRAGQAPWLLLGAPGDRRFDLLTSPKSVTEEKMRMTAKPLDSNYVSEHSETLSTLKKFLS